MSCKLQASKLSRFRSATCLGWERESGTTGMMVLQFEIANVEFVKGFMGID